MIENVVTLFSLKLNWISCFLVAFLQQALVGESSGEEQLFSSESGSSRDGVEFGSELDSCLRKLKVAILLPSLQKSIPERATFTEPFIALIESLL